MANIKIPSAFFSSEIWRKDRVFSEAEAYLDLLTLSSPIPLRTLARRWGWKHPREVRFLRWLNASCTTFVPPCVPLILQNNNALQGFCTTSCTTFVPPLREKPPLQETKERSKEKKEYTPSKENISPLSTNVDIPPTPFAKFQKWLLDNAPSILKMEEPFTEFQFTKAKEDFGVDMMQEILQEMHNWQPLLKKNKSAYLTFRVWATKRKEKVPLKRKDNGNNYRLDSTLCKDFDTDIA